MNIFVTGNDTGVGKTVVAAILTQALGADYWKPVQAGDLASSDTMTVTKLVTNAASRFHPESFRLTQAMSPHAAAARDGVIIALARLHVPNTSNHLIIEGAGGVMVPLNEGEFMLDLITAVSQKTVVVSRNYLGSINHTILTIKALQDREVPVAGVIFNGEENLDSQSIILSATGTRQLGHLRPEPAVTAEVVQHYANQWREALFELI